MRCTAMPHGLRPASLCNGCTVHTAASTASPRARDALKDQRLKPPAESQCPTAVRICRSSLRSARNPVISRLRTLASARIRALPSLQQELTTVIFLASQAGAKFSEACCAIAARAVPRLRAWDSPEVIGSDWGAEPLMTGSLQARVVSRPTLQEDLRLN